MFAVLTAYYGSEWGIEGKKDGSDRPLRPALDLESVSRNAANRGLAPVISRLARVRGETEALRGGDYAQLHVSHERLAFARSIRERKVIVAVNSGADPAPLRLELPGMKDAELVDLLNPGDSFSLRNGKAVIDPLPPRWGRIMEAR